MQLGFRGGLQNGNFRNVSAFILRPTPGSISGDSGRLDDAREQIPENLRERVLILGAWSEPEELRTDLGSYENIGSALARDCRDDTDTTWGHVLLKHNSEELARLRTRVRPILF